MQLICETISATDVRDDYNANLQLYIAVDCYIFVPVYLFIARQCD